MVNQERTNQSDCFFTPVFETLALAFFSRFRKKGDALFLSGPSRRFYHGVPIILDPSTHLVPRSQEEVTALEVLGKGRINLNVRQVE